MKFPKIPRISSDLITAKTAKQAPKIAVAALLIAGIAKGMVVAPDVTNAVMHTDIELPNAAATSIFAMKSKSDDTENSKEGDTKVSNEKQCPKPPEELLLAIRKERSLIEKDREKAETKMSEADLAREQIQIESDNLKELKAEVKGLLDRVKKAHTSDVDRLIALYQGMKPDEAAEIMDDLDIEVTVMVLGKMPERGAAPIMAEMSPVRSRAVSKIIYERSKLPGDQDLNGIKLK